MSQHLEQLADKWFPLLESPDRMPGVVGTVLEQGGTRPVWRTEHDGQESMLMAWPETSLLRAAVLLEGPKDGQLEPTVAVPLMEGFPNAMMVLDTHLWKEGSQGEVQVQHHEGAEPLWFYDPLFFRDSVTDLTPGVIQTFYLSGLCYGIRRALLDELTITTGPSYEAYAAQWLKDNPGKGRLDVPLLKVPLENVAILAPTPRRSEYQARGRIYDVDSFMFGPEGDEAKIYRFGTVFGTEEHPIHIILYAPEKMCMKGYVPEEGHEVDVIFWMQGRIVDVGDEVPEMEENPVQE